MPHTDEHASSIPTISATNGDHKPHVWACFTPSLMSSSLATRLTHPTKTFAQRRRLELITSLPNCCTLCLPHALSREKNLFDTRCRALTSSLLSVQSSILLLCKYAIEPSVPSYSPYALTSLSLSSLVLLHNQSSPVRLYRDFNSLGYPSLLLQPTNPILRFMYMMPTVLLILKQKRGLCGNFGRLPDYPFGF